MWHNTMLAGCRPVWDLSSITVKRETGFLKSSCRGLKLKVRLKRSLPGPSIHEDSNECCDWLSQKQQEQLMQRRSSLLLWKPCTSRCPYCWQGGITIGFKTLSILAQERSPAVKLYGSKSNNLAVLFAAVGTKKDAEQKLQKNSDTAVQGQASDQERNVGEREKMRRHRISVANKGKVPWNKGGKHSPETIKRIKERTSQAMHSPTVMAKLRLNPRHSQTDETRLKIREKLREKWDMKKRIHGYQELMLKDWRHGVAEAARKGGLGEEEMEWNSYYAIKHTMRLEATALLRLERVRQKGRVKVKTAGKSREHRQKISDAIRAKWEDPEYQLKVRNGMKKHGEVSKPRKKTIPAKRKPEAGVIREPLDHGFVTAVMSGEKRRNAKELAAKLLDGKDIAESAKHESRFRNRKVNLLKRFTAPTRSAKDNFADTDNQSTGELSISAAHSFVDPLANDKLHRLKLLQAGRSVMDQKRREAAQRAEVLIAEAERAADVLEAVAGDNELALTSLIETRQIMEEAAHFMHRAESVNKLVDGINCHHGDTWCSTFASDLSATSELQMKLQGVHLSKQRQEDTAILSLGSHVTNEPYCYLRTGENIEVGIISATRSAMLDNAEAMKFGRELKEKAAWDAQSPFVEESAATNKLPGTLGN